MYKTLSSTRRKALPTKAGLLTYMLEPVQNCLNGLYMITVAGAATDFHRLPCFIRFGHLSSSIEKQLIKRKNDTHSYSFCQGERILILSKKIDLYPLITTFQSSLNRDDDAESRGDGKHLSHKYMNYHIATQRS